VRGTVFDVIVEDEDATTLVSVDEGIVNVRHRVFGDEKDLQAGESTRVFKNQRLAQQVNKGAIAQKALRAAAQAVYDVILTRPGGVGSPSGGGTPTGGGTTGGGQQSDKGDKGNTGNTGNTGGTTAPPPPPPPPPSGTH